MPRRPLPPLGEMRDFINRNLKTERRVTLLEQPDAAQTGRRIQRLEELLAAVPDISVSISTGTINATGIITAAGGFNSPAVYSNLVSTGAYRVQYINISGAMGYVPSSLQFKQDVNTAPDVAAAMLAMRVVTFRYRQAVAELGEGATVEWGVIAEEIESLGLTWLVDYDSEGKPEGVKYERLVLGVIPIIQDHEERLRAAGL